MHAAAQHVLRNHHTRYTALTLPPSLWRAHGHWCCQRQEQIHQHIPDCILPCLHGGSLRLLLIAHSCRHSMHNLSSFNVPTCPRSAILHASEAYLKKPVALSILCRRQHMARRPSRQCRAILSSAAAAGPAAVGLPQAYGYGKLNGPCAASPATSG